MSAIPAFCSHDSAAGSSLSLDDLKFAKRRFLKQYIVYKKEDFEQRSFIAKIDDKEIDLSVFMSALKEKYVLKRDISILIPDSHFVLFCNYIYTLKNHLIVDEKFPNEPASTSTKEKSQDEIDLDRDPLEDEYRFGMVCQNTYITAEDLAIL
jgi:hypothetical protein